MKQKCRYNKKRDLREVAPHLAIDLGECLRTGTIPGSGTEPNYNEIENTADVAGRVTDVFQSLDVERASLAQGRQDASFIKSQANVSEQTNTNTVVNPE